MERRSNGRRRSLLTCWFIRTRGPIRVNIAGNGSIRNPTWRNTLTSIPVCIQTWCELEIYFRAFYAGPGVTVEYTYRIDFPIDIPMHHIGPNQSERSSPASQFQVLRVRVVWLLALLGFHHFSEAPVELLIHIIRFDIDPWQQQQQITISLLFFDRWETSQVHRLQ